jgi:DNA-binding response OmpR family regulator
MKQILIVEDEPNMLQGLKDNLEFEGYEVATTSNGKEGLKMILTGKFHLVLLDVMLPEMSGFDVCKEVRSKKNMTPIIMLTAKGEELDKVLGLEFGADDYITKPFSLRELLARVKALLRRSSASEGEISNQLVSIGRLSADFTRFSIEVDGAEASFTHKEFEVLRFLWEHKNRVVSREQLIESVWGLGYEPTHRTIDNFIVKLRHKIEEEPSKPKQLLTVHGVGYKLIN